MMLRLNFSIWGSAKKRYFLSIIKVDELDTMEHLIVHKKPNNKPNLEDFKRALWFLFLPSRQRSNVRKCPTLTCWTSTLIVTMKKKIILFSEVMASVASHYTSSIWRQKKYSIDLSAQHTLFATIYNDWPGGKIYIYCDISPFIEKNPLYNSYCIVFFYKILVYKHFCRTESL